MKTTKEMIKVMQAHADGRKVECVEMGLPLAQEYTSWDWSAYDYRIKPLEFPPLPEGLEWHISEEDRDRMTPELVGPNHRLAVVGELIPEGGECYYTSHNGWRASNRIGRRPTSGDTIRVPISTPFPESTKKKVMVPLDARDVPPGSVFTLKGRIEEDWTAPIAVSETGITFALGFDGCNAELTVKGWEHAQQHYLIKRPGQDWQPCEKEAP